MFKIKNKISGHVLLMFVYDIYLYFLQRDDSSGC